MTISICPTVAHPAAATPSLAKGLFTAYLASVAATCRLLVIRSENLMSRKLATVLLATAVCACLSVAAMAQSQSAAKQVCPATYWLMGTLCLNDDTGDVVMASTPETNRIASRMACRPGYWRMAGVCLDLESGDVELADGQAPPAERQAEVRK
jgi:hypothetical protein